MKGALLGAQYPPPALGPGREGGQSSRGRGTPWGQEGYQMLGVMPPSFLAVGGGQVPLAMAPGPGWPPDALSTPAVRPLGLMAGLAGHHHLGLPESLPQLPPGGPAGEPGPREGAAAGPARPPRRLPGWEERRRLGPASPLARAGRRVPPWVAALALPSPHTSHASCWLCVQC